MNRAHFTPPHARQLGQQIRTVKRILNVILSTHSEQLYDKAFNTFLVEVEAVVNSKPLTVESVDDCELKALSPQMVMTMKGEQVVLPPSGEFVRAGLVPQTSMATPPIHHQPILVTVEENISF